MKPGGSAFLSTLNLKKNQKPGQAYNKSPHHDKEFEPRELRELLEKHYSDVRLYGLYPTLRHAFFERLKKTGVFRSVPDVWNPAERFYRGILPSDFKWLLKQDLDDSIDLMGVCR